MPLFDNHWFEVAISYATLVRDFVNQITSTSITFPEAGHGHSEGRYNESVEELFPDAVAMLDRQNFYPGGAATPIEFCDLLTMAGELIHVKKRTSSGTLSHLFSQGSVSCELFLLDPTLRTAVRQRLIALNRSHHVDVIPVDQPIAADYEVVYAVIASEGMHGWPPALQFFSSVNLMHHAKRVQSLGFSVSLQYIRQLD